MVRTIELPHERRSPCAEAVAAVIAVFFPACRAADLIKRIEHVIAERAPFGEVGGENHAGCRLLGGVAGGAAAVEDRLDIAAVHEHVGHALRPARLGRRALGREQRALPLQHLAAGVLVALLVAAHAALDLPRHHLSEVLHALDGNPLLVERREHESPQRGHLEAGAAVRLHRHLSDDPVQRDVPSVGAPRAVSARAFRQILHDQKFFDRPARNILHVAALVDIREHEHARFLRAVDLLRQHRLARTRPEGLRIMHHHRVGPHGLARALPVHELQVAAARHKEAVAGQRIGIAEPLHAERPAVADAPPKRFRDIRPDPLRRRVVIRPSVEVHEV